MRLRGEAVPTVLVTVAGVRGSAPREVGASMLVTASYTQGTIGGGELEYQCSKIAAQLQNANGDGCLRRFPLGSNCGQCCGGVVDVLFEPLQKLDILPAIHAAWQSRETCWLVTEIDPQNRPQKSLLHADGRWRGRPLAVSDTLDVVTALQVDQEARRLDTPGRGQAFQLVERLVTNDFDIAVFGAGHVGSAVVQILSGLDCRLRWIDSRRGIFPVTPDNVQSIVCDNPEREVAALPPGTHAIVMTHSHALDLGIVAALLRRDDLAWCGLIGSVTKRRRFKAKLQALGLSSAQLAALICPIGIAGVSGKKPQEIAVAVAAQLLRLREQQAHSSVRDQRNLSLVQN